jgi:hypothetical protein
MQALLRQKIEVFDRAEMILGESDVFHMEESLENLFQQFSRFLSEALRKCPFYQELLREKERALRGESESEEKAVDNSYSDSQGY